MNDKKGNANIEFELINSYLTVGMPALVGNVGVIGEYYITGNPDPSNPFEVGFAPDGNEPNFKLARNLNDVVSVLNEEFGVNIDELSVIWQLDKAINTAKANPEDFIFTARHDLLSGNPAFTTETEGGLIYISYEREFLVGRYSDGDDAEFSFNSIDEAKEFIITKYAIRISDKSKRELENFLAYVRLENPN